MTTHRRYYFIHPTPYDDEQGHAAVLAHLQEACERHWWFNEPKVTGLAFGRLTFEFTSSARDQWWCHSRAMRLAGECYRKMGLKESQVPDPLWEPLEPHRNRGRYRIPKMPDTQPE